MLPARLDVGQLCLRPASLLLPSPEIFNRMKHRHALIELVLLCFPLMHDHDRLVSEFAELGSSYIDNVIIDNDIDMCLPGLCDPCMDLARNPKLLQLDVEAGRRDSTPSIQIGLIFICSIFCPVANLCRYHCNMRMDMLIHVSDV
jgi:hypothetical protein